MLAAEFELFAAGSEGGAAAVRAEALQRVPMRRFATAAEVADAIFYLVADAPYATGTTLALDGGTTAI